MKVDVKKTIKVNISKKDFEAYEEVRESGVTNMFMISTVISHSGLSRDKVKAIMSNYDVICKKYSDVRKE